MKKLVIPGIIVLCLIVLIAGVAGTVKFMLTSRYDAEVAAIKAKGEPTTFQELIGGPIPDDQNAAVAYRKLDAEIESGAYDKAFAIIREIRPIPGGQMGSNDWAKLERAVAETEPLRPLIDDIASRPHYRPTSKLSGILNYCPHPGDFWRVEELLRLSALVNARRGRMGQAAGDILTQIKVAHSIRNEPFLHYPRLRALRDAAKSVQAVSDYGDLSETDTRTIFDALGEADFSSSHRRYWEGQRVAFIQFTGPDYFKQMAAWEWGAKPDTVPTPPGHSLWGRPLMRGDLAAFLSYATDQINGANLPYAQARARGLLDWPKHIPVYAVATKRFITLAWEFDADRYMCEERVARARVFLALQAYRTRFGRYPASMLELKTKLGWKLPKDPFSGKDFIYKRQAKGFILYSVGPDMKDDGGRAIPDDSVDLDSKGDLVLERER